MTQTTFFDTFDEQALTPAARRTDPPTSHQAAAEVPLSHAQQVALEAAARLTRDFGDCTATEIGLAAHDLDRSCMAETYRKRVRELAEGGMLRESGARRCNFTGKSAAVFVRPE